MLATKAPIIDNIQLCVNEHQ